LTGQGSNPNSSPLSDTLSDINKNLSDISKDTENLSSIKTNTDLIPKIKEKTDKIDEIQTNTKLIPGIEGTVDGLPNSLAATVEADVSEFSKGLHEEYSKIINDYQKRVTGDLDTHLQSMIDARDTVVSYYRDLKADIVKNNDSLTKLYGDLLNIKEEITLKQDDRNTIMLQAKNALEVAQHIDGIMSDTVSSLTLLYNNALKKVTDAAGIDIEMTQMYKSLEVYTDKISSAQELVIKSLDAVNQLAGVSGNLNQATTEILKSSGSIKEMQTVIDQVAENTQKNVQILSDVMTKINESSVKAIETFNNNLITLSNNFLKMKEVEDANNRSDKRIDQVIEGVKALTDVADSINGANGVNAMHSANVIESRKWH
jgi:phage shock protein A